MQIRGLPRHVIRGACRASRLIDAQSPSNAAASRRDALARWQQARRDGLTAAKAAAVVGTPLASLYRWQNRLQPRSTRPHTLRLSKVLTPKLCLAVETLRQRHPMWGRDKLAPMLWKQGFTASVSTIGRILASLVARGVVQPVPQIRKGSRHAPRKHTRAYARRKPKHVEATAPGDIVQVDTVHINLAPGKAIRHFTAYCTIAKWTVAQAFNRATAASATRFLDKLKDDLPFKLRAIQVDGGSEFMAQFEDACRERGIALDVLPPRSPKLNGGVERCNGASCRRRAIGTTRYEFYACTELPDTVEALNPLIDDWQDTYNHLRPHGALSGLTPAEDLTRQPAPEPHASSQMS